MFNLVKTENLLSPHFLFIYCISSNLRFRWNSSHTVCQHCTSLCREVLIPVLRLLNEVLLRSDTCFRYLRHLLSCSFVQQSLSHEESSTNNLFVSCLFKRDTFFNLLINNSTNHYGLHCVLITDDWSSLSSIELNRLLKCFTALVIISLYELILHL